MRWFCGCITILITALCPAQAQTHAASRQFQLAKPKVFIDSTFFTKSARLTALFSFEGSTIHYTTNGEEVTKSSPLYSNPIEITRSSLIKLRVFHEDFRPSTTLEVGLKRLTHRIDQTEINFDPEPHSAYAGKGVQSLVDGQKGSLQFRNGKQWLGFQSDTIRLHLKFNNALPLSRISLSILADQNSWIFSPEEIRVTAGKRVVGRWTKKTPKANRPAELSYIDLDIENSIYDSLSVLIKPLAQIPDWHPGKGTKPWFFIDEILVE